MKISFNAALNLTILALFATISLVAVPQGYERWTKMEDERRGQ